MWRFARVGRLDVGRARWRTAVVAVATALAVWFAVALPAGAACEGCDRAVPTVAPAPGGAWTPRVADGGRCRGICGELPATAAVPAAKDPPGPASSGKAATGIAKTDGRLPRRGPIPTPDPGDTGDAKSQDRLATTPPGHREKVGDRLGGGGSQDARVDTGAGPAVAGPAGGVPSPSPPARQSVRAAPETVPTPVVSPKPTAPETASPPEVARTGLRPRAGPGKAVGPTTPPRRPVPTTAQRHRLAVAAGVARLRLHPSDPGDVFGLAESDRSRALDGWAISVSGDLARGGPGPFGDGAAWDVRVIGGTRTHRSGAGLAPAGAGPVAIVAPDGTLVSLAGAGGGPRLARHRVEVLDARALVRLGPRRPACHFGPNCRAGWLAGLRLNRVEEGLRGLIGTAGVGFAERHEVVREGLIGGVWAHTQHPVARIAGGDVVLEFDAKAYLEAGLHDRDDHLSLAGIGAFSDRTRSGYVAAGGEFGAAIVWRLGPASLSVSANLARESDPRLATGSNGRSRRSGQSGSETVLVRGSMEF